MKPYKGRIRDWRFYDVGEYTIVCGRFVDHPDFGCNVGHTSYIVDKTEQPNGNIMVETRNSRYLLIKDRTNEKQTSAVRARARAQS